MKTEARNMQYVYHAVEVFYEGSPTQQRAYADAIGLLLSLPTPIDARPGPVGGGFPTHSIFFNPSTYKCQLPYEFDSKAYLAEKVNEVRNY